MSKIIRQQSGFKFDNDITYSPDGSLIAACGLNNLVIQDARTGREIFAIKVNPSTNISGASRFQPMATPSPLALKIASRSGTPALGN